MARPCARRSAALLGASLLAGCVTPPAYGPIGAVNGSSGPAIYGYQESAQGPGRYTLKVLLPAASGAAQAFDFWDRRAGELCGPQGYRKNIYSAVRPTVPYQYYGGMPGDFQLEGLLECTALPPAPP